jgi:predicted HicB family RNase H-like nuclease
MGKNTRLKVQNVVLILRVPKTLRDAMRKLAVAQMTSVSTVARQALTKAVKDG